MFCFGQGLTWNELLLKLLSCSITHVHYPIETAMPLELILRIPRSDQEGEYVLVNVTSNGPAPLDLRLLATEGLSPYISNSKAFQTSTLWAMLIIAANNSQAVPHPQISRKEQSPQQRAMGGALTLHSPPSIFPWKACRERRSHDA